MFFGRQKQNGATMNEQELLCSILDRPQEISEFQIFFNTMQKSIKNSMTKFRNEENFLKFENKREKNKESSLTSGSKKNSKPPTPEESHQIYELSFFIYFICFFLFLSNRINIQLFNFYLSKKKYKINNSKYHFVLCVEQERESSSTKSMVQECECNIFFLQICCCCFVYQPSPLHVQNTFERTWPIRIHDFLPFFYNLIFIYYFSSKN